MTTTKALVTYLDDLLQLKNFTSDGSNNGLQVEASSEIQKVGFAVDASQAFFDLAAEDGCDFLFVHHGISWGGSLKRITGMDANRVGTLFRNNMSLYGAHLPLDAHPEVGHNAVMAKLFDLEGIKPFAKYAGTEIGYYGTLPAPLKMPDLLNKIEEKLGTECTLLCPENPNRLISTLGIVSGGAADCIGDAAALGLDAFLTGEFIHQHYHTVKELDLPLIAGGHYRTECPGVLTVMDKIQKDFGLECKFYDIPTGL